MKDSQREKGTGGNPHKYIKANNERFSTYYDQLDHLI